MPSPGVYAGAAKVAGASYKTVVNIGVRPTFRNSQDKVIEAHLLRFRGSAYGEAIEIEIYKRLREEQRFPSVKALAQQIKRDIQAAKDVNEQAGAPC